MLDDEELENLTSASPVVSEEEDDEVRGFYLLCLGVNGHYGGLNKVNHELW